jgi:hypothetical protein
MSRLGPARSRGDSSIRWLAGRRRRADWSRRRTDRSPWLTSRQSSNSLWLRPFSRSQPAARVPELGPAPTVPRRVRQLWSPGRHSLPNLLQRSRRVPELVRHQTRLPSPPGHRSSRPARRHRRTLSRGNTPRRSRDEPTRLSKASWVRVPFRTFPTGSSRNSMPDYDMGDADIDLFDSSTSTSIILMIMTAACAPWKRVNGETDDVSSRPWRKIAIHLIICSSSMCLTPCSRSSWRLLCWFAVFPIFAEKRRSWSRLHAPPTTDHPAGR